MTLANQCRLILQITPYAKIVSKGDITSGEVLLDDYSCFLESLRWSRKYLTEEAQGQ